MGVTVDDLIRFVDRWQRRKIVVVGDFMLDHYVYGDAERLSPDAPVPVLTMRDEQFVPGGASNVCLDLLALQCNVTCLGVVGRDDTAVRLRAALKEAGCNVTGLLTATDRPTTVKHSFVGLAQHRHPQKMFRVDDERKLPIADTIAHRIIEHARKQMRGAAALCIEDYNKGVIRPDLCQRLINLARQMKVPVLIDPAAIDDYSKYRGATCLTPNRTEAALATGHTDIDDMATSLIKQLKLKTLVLTLDKQGALLVEKGKRPVTVPTQARAVYDVTGAGDMVLAMLAAARANDADWHTATQLANIAAGLEVEKFGVVPIELSQVLLALLQQHHEELGKHRTIDQLLIELDAYRKQGKSIIFTNGCFDILHAGHISYLRQARQAGDLLVVGLNSDASISRIKGDQRPVNKQADRIMVLSELQCVDYVVVFDNDTPIDFIKTIKPDVLVKGADYKRSEVIGGDIVEKHGGRVVLVPLVKGRSTTNIIRKVQSQK